MAVFSKFLICDFWAGTGRFENSSCVFLLQILNKCDLWKRLDISYIAIWKDFDFEEIRDQKSHSQSFPTPPHSPASEEVISNILCSMLQLIDRFMIADILTPVILPDASTKWLLVFANIVMTFSSNSNRLMITFSYIVNYYIFRWRCPDISVINIWHIWLQGW